jgi:arylsulfatase A-like enzyme
MASNSNGTTTRPNILLITCDQFRFPRFSYGEDGGFAQPLKEILGFKESVGADNPYAKFFPGLLKLWPNAVSLANHTIASSACTPSRGVIYTGQYGTKTGVTQTDGLFKNGDSPDFPWLAADGIPTLGAWMRQAGYETHYFGKWHLSNPPDHSLDAYGFSDWELSYPEPHGALVNNLGVYRDLGFVDSACAFLRRKGLGIDYARADAEMAQQDPNSGGPDPDDVKPWFAVASFTNPHDIATYPTVIAQILPKPGPNETGTQSVFGPLTVPETGDVTPPPIAGTFEVPLNPLGFPQDCANPAPTQDESLEGKPTAQHEAAYKVGLGFAAKSGYNLASKAGKDDEAAVGLAFQCSLPLQLSDQPDQYSLLFLQFYAWLHSVVDAHVNAVLTALEESGQAGNTIVIFLSDHGEYGAAHGMMIEKWHTAYEEVLHVPLVVRFPDPDHGGRRNVPVHAPAQLEALTSHIDIVPTILGLAGVDAEQREQIRLELESLRSQPVPELIGADLSGAIESALDGAGPGRVVEPDGREREGVLFITDDEITEPLLPPDEPQNEQGCEEYALYEKVVAAVRAGKGKGPVDLAPGAVAQPNHVRCVRTMKYKLARYFDPTGTVEQQWEMYDLRHDPNEVVNLVEVDASPPKLRDLPGQPVDQATVDELAALLAALEAKYL